MVTRGTPSAQASLIGCLLMHGDRLGREMLAVLRDEDFLDADYRNILRLCRETILSGATITPQLIAQRAGKDAVGMLADCIEVASFERTWRQDAQIIAEESRVARLQRLGMRIVNAKNSGDQAKICEEGLAICAQRGQETAPDVSQMMDCFWAEQDKPTRFLATGLAPLDDKLAISQEDLIVIGGRPSAGKTAFALQLMAHIAKTKRVTFFSLETSRNKIMQRLISQMSGVPLQDIKYHRLTPMQRELIKEKQKEILKLKIKIEEASGKSAEWIKSKLYENNAEVIFLDYLQLVREDGWNRTEEVTKISIKIAEIAHDLHITTFALSQLSRMEKGTSRAPTLGDLRESGQIEQDADAVLLLSFQREAGDYAEAFGWGETPATNRILDIAKNKEGEIGLITLSFNGQIQRFGYGHTPKTRTEPEYEQEAFDVPPGLFDDAGYSGFRPKD